MEMTKFRTFCCVRNYIYYEKIKKTILHKCVIGKEKPGLCLFSTPQVGKVPPFIEASARVAATP